MFSRAHELNSSVDEDIMTLGETCPYDREGNWVTKKLTKWTKRTAVYVFICLLACFALYWEDTSHIAKVDLFLIFEMVTSSLTKENNRCVGSRDKELSSWMEKG